MAQFFPGRSPGNPGLAVFLTAGAEPFEALMELAAVLDDRGVDALELGVPFPDSVTDGPVLRRCAARSLARGTGLSEVLAFVTQVRPTVRRLRIVVLADWSHTVRALGMDEFVRRVAAAGADASLVHALPPRCREAYQAATTAAGLPVVSTCYPTSNDTVRDRAAREATAYLYLVAHQGRTGTTVTAHDGDLATTITGLRRTTGAPIAVGFGVRSGADVRRVADAGADAAVVGTAAAQALDRALERSAATGSDPATDFNDFIRSLDPASRPVMGTRS